jgi:5'-nucleotidase
MHRLLNWTIIAVAALAVLGCENNKDDVAAVPPPSDSYVNVPPPAPEPVLLPPTQQGQPINGSLVSGSPALGGSVGAGGTYTVQRGDTLWSIAKRAYGDGQKWQQVAAANGISDPSRLAEGQRLVLP